MRTAGYLAFCGGDAAGDVYCWGFGPAPLLGLGRGAPVTTDHTLWRGARVDIEADMVVGNGLFGCAFVDGTVRCVAADADALGDCPGGLTVGAVVDAPPIEP